jgi:hypothetical protein
MSIEHKIKTRNGETRVVNLTPMKAIRQYCLQCLGFSAKEVRQCGEAPCALHPYRMGRNISRKGIGGIRRKKPNLRRHLRRV